MDADSFAAKVSRRKVEEETDKQKSIPACGNGSEDYAKRRKQFAKQAIR
jgi:hypothetical protein